MAAALSASHPSNSRLKKQEESGPLQSEVPGTVLYLLYLKEMKVYLLRPSQEKYSSQRGLLHTPRYPITNALLEHLIHLVWLFLKVLRK